MTASRPRARPAWCTSATWTRASGASRRRRLRLFPRRRIAGARRAHPRAHPQPGDPAGLDRRLDLLRRRNGHLQATGRDARGRKQYRYHPRFREAARGEQVRPHARVRAGPAAVARRRRAAHGVARAAAREGAGCRGASAGKHADPGRQRRLRPAEPQLRADDAAQPARRDRGLRSCASSSRARAARAGACSCRTGAWPRWCAPARTCPASACSSTSTKPACCGR